MKGKKKILRLARTVLIQKFQDMIHKNIVVIKTPITQQGFTQVTCMMSDDELREAKAERPDLIFTLARDMEEAVGIETGEREPIPEIPVIEDETKGITVRGMTLPHNLEYLIDEVLKEK